MPTLAEAPFVDFADPAVAADPEPFFTEARRHGAVARTPLGASVVRREEVRQLFSDSRLVSSIPALVAMQGVTEGRVHDMVASSVIAIDGADHTRLRRLVSRSFTPAAAARHRTVMRALVTELVERFAASGRCEFVTDFADHYPVQVICEVLGVPRDDHALFARWGNALTFILSLELADHRHEVETAVEELREYMDGLVADRRASPRDDLVTSLVQASEDGDRLSSNELFSMIGGLLFAGYDTTRNQLSAALSTFCDYPEQWALLAAQPDLAPRAVEEAMRLFGVIRGVPRIATEALEIGRYTIPAGTLVTLHVASANRDERSFDDPLEFDIAAEREGQMTFGGGPHYCLGVHLARAEMEEALRILPARMPGLRRDGEEIWRLGSGIQGPAVLPLAFGTA